MLNAVMLTCNRPRLTEQCLRTFTQNTRGDWNLTVIDDCSSYHTSTVLSYFRSRNLERMAVLQTSPAVRVLGRLKNLGVYWSQVMFGRGTYLYVMDNDGYYTEGWDLKMVMGMQHGDDTRIKLLGPYRHPYHLPYLEVFPAGTTVRVSVTDAVQGIGHMMSWETWAIYGPYDANAPGTNQSEDYALCRRIVDSGYMVGSLNPEVVHNCGITDTQGKPCIGIETMTERVKGVLYE